MPFSPKNYDTHGDGTLTPDENGKVPCCCGRKVWPFVLVEVKHLDNILTPEKHVVVGFNENGSLNITTVPPRPFKWACDSCWTHWQRVRHPVMKADKGNSKLKSANRMTSRKEWDDLWLKHHGAPQTVRDKIKQQNRRA